jgi:hypothetical protein
MKSYLNEIKELFHFSIQSRTRFKADNQKFSFGCAPDICQPGFDVNNNIDLIGQLNPFDNFSVSTSIDLGGG